MTSHHTDSLGRRWAIEFEIFKDEIDIIDVHLDGVQVPKASTILTNDSAQHSLAQKNSLKLANVT